MEALGRVVCAVSGKHRWDYATDACTRCRRTSTAIIAGAMTTHRLVAREAYDRGFREGGVLSDRAKQEAYSAGVDVGYQMGLATLDELLNPSEEEH